LRRLYAGSSLRMEADVHEKLEPFKQRVSEDIRRRGRDDE
jgi:hypothetical protein